MPPCITSATALSPHARWVPVPLASEILNCTEYTLRNRIKAGVIAEVFVWRPYPNMWYLRREYVDWPNYAAQLEAQALQQVEAILNP